MGEVLCFSKSPHPKKSRGSVASPHSDRSAWNPIEKALDEYFSRPFLSEESKKMLEEIIDWEYAHEKS